MRLFLELRMGPLSIYYEQASVSKGQRLLQRKMEHKYSISYHTCSEAGNTYLPIHNLAFGL